MANGSVTRAFALGSVVMMGLLGGGVGRALIDTPAWQRLGVGAWADYSRQADLGNGLIIYPVFGIGTLILVFGAAISYRFDRRANPAAAPAIYTAALALVGAAVTTAKAAPIMLSISGLRDASPALAQAFEDFTLWGVYVRGAFFAIAFFASLWAVVSLGERPTSAPRRADPGTARGAAVTHVG